MEEKPPMEQETAAGSPEGEAGGVEPSSAGNSKAELEKKDREIKALSDQVLRAYAELDNFKKRAAKDKSDWLRYSNEGLLKELLEVLDNLQRARHHGENKPDVAQWAEGVSLTIKHFEDILSKAGVKPIKALGERFDPAVHQAMAQVEAEGEAGMVVDEHQKGYFLHDRVLRPSLVTVSRKKETDSSKEEGGNS
jgi:molecular chaperone GrpE